MAEQQNNRNRIVFYGPTSAGKSTLWQSFKQAVKIRQSGTEHQIQRGIPLAGQGMEIVLHRREQIDRGDHAWQAIPMVPEIYKLPPNDDIDAGDYRILRKPMDGENEYKHHVSTACHYLTIIDDKGGLWGAAMNPSNSILEVINGKVSYVAPMVPQDPSKVRDAWGQLMSAGVIFILLDPSQLKLETTTSPSTPSNVSEATAASTSNQDLQPVGPAAVPVKIEQPSPDDKLTREQYATMVQRIADLRELCPRDKQNKRIAVCCVKMDWVYPKRDSFLATAANDPDGYIRSQFGRGMLDTIQLLSGTYGPENVRAFLMSATGWGIDKQSNHNPAPGGRERKIPLVRDQENWYPYEVEKPFLWVFEALEKQYIHSNVQRIALLWQLLGGVGRRKNTRVIYP